MIMKMHSYLSTNGQLGRVDKQAQRVLAQLKKAADTSDGWDAALQTAEAAIVQSESPVESGTPEVPEDAPVGSTTSYVDARVAVTLRQRLQHAAAANSHLANGVASVRTTGTNVDAAAFGPGGVPTYPPTASEILTHHPDEAIAALAKHHVELERELTGAVEGRVRWPANITLRDFAWYQLTPTLVYELEYPRTSGIRPLYVFEKTVAFFGTFALLYTIVETFIIPLTPTPDQSFARSLLDLALPFMLSYLLLFYIIFGMRSYVVVFLSTNVEFRVYLQRLRRAELVSKRPYVVRSRTDDPVLAASRTASSTMTGGTRHHGTSSRASGTNQCTLSFSDMSTRRR